MIVLTTCRLMLGAMLALQTLPPADGEPAPPRSTGTDILTLIPSDATFVGAVRDLEAFDAKVKAAMENTGVAFSPFTALKSWLEIVAGLSDHGAAAMFFLPRSAATGQRPDLAMLLPTADREDLLAFLSPQMLSDGNAKVTLRGHDSYAGFKEGYTIFAPELRVVRYVAAASRGIDTRWSPYQMERYRANDLTLWLDPAGLGLGAAATSVPVPPSIDPVVSLLRQMNAEGLQLSGRVDTTGVFLEGLAQLPPAPALPPRSADDPPMLAGLLEEPVAFAFGAVGYGEREPWASCLRALMASLTKANICAPGGTDRFVEAVVAAQAMVQCMAVSVTPLPPEVPGALAVTKVLRTQGDGAALVQQIERIAETLRAGMFIHPNYNAALQRLIYRRSAETINGVAVDHLAIDLTGYDTDDAEKVRNFVGGDQLIVRVAIVAPGRVVVAFGGGADRFGRIIDTVRSGEAPLASRFKLRPPLDDTAQPLWLEGYLTLGQWSRLVRQMPSGSEKSTAPSSRDIDTPLIITAHRPVSTVSRFDLFVPLEVIADGKDAWLPSRARSGVGIQ